jgi:hypothetical protein
MTTVVMEMENHVGPSSYFFLCGYWLGTTKTGQPPNPDGPKNAQYSIFFVHLLSVTFLSTINACFF